MIELINGEGTIEQRIPAMLRMFGKLTIRHTAEFAAEMESAGIKSDIISPKLLPTYTHGHE